MNPPTVPLVDIISPVVTFVMVIALPSALALWIMYRNIFKYQQELPGEQGKGDK